MVVFPRSNPLVTKNFEFAMNEITGTIHALGNSRLLFFCIIFLTNGLISNFF
jgi:hypothetical protein